MIGLEILFSDQKFSFQNSKPHGLQIFGENWKSQNFHIKITKLSNIHEHKHVLITRKSTTYS